MMSSSGCGEMIMMVLPLMSRKGLPSSGGFCWATPVKTTENSTNISTTFLEIIFFLLMSLCGERLGNVAPLYQRNVLLLQELLELAAADHIEIVLSPSCTPVGMVPGGSTHFIVI